MGYVSQENIRIFPSSSRGVNSGHFGDNFVTEYNLSSIVNKLLDPNINGFLITTDIKADPVEFNIGGYFVSVGGGWQKIVDASNNESSDDSFTPSTFVTFEKGNDNTSTYIYAVIKVNTTPDVSYSYISGEDGGSSTSGGDDGVIRLPIMQVIGAGTTAGASDCIPNTGAKLMLTNFICKVDDGVL